MAERKKPIIQKMLPPQNIPIPQLARDTGISDVTLYNWRKHTRVERVAVPADGKNPEKWSLQGKFAIILETTIRPVSLLLGLLLLSIHPAGLAIKDGQAFNDWKALCPGKETGDQVSCHIFQNLVAKDGKTRILHIAIGYVKGKKEPAAIITLPLGISLAPGIGLRVDDDQSVRFPFHACFNSGCQAGFPVNDALMDKFKKGSKLFIRVYDLSNQPADIPVSLKGFTAAIEALKAGK